MTAMCLLALAAAHASSQDAMATPITLHYPVADTKGCVEALEKSANVRLTVAPELAGQPILLRVKNRPLKSVMDSMADALGGEWAEQNGVWKLSEDRELARQETAEFNRELSAAISEGMKTTLESIKVINWNGPEGKEQVKAEMDKLKKIAESVRADNPNLPPGMNVTIMAGGSGDASPAHNLLRSMLVNITPEQLMDIPYDGSIVLSDSPTARQGRLKGSIAGPVRDFVSAHNALAGVVTDAQSGLPQGINLRSATLNTKPIEGGIQKVLLQIKRDQSGRNFTFILKIADRTGKFVGTANSWVNALPPTEAASASTFELGAKASELVEIKPTSRELAAVLNKHQAGGGNYQTVAIAAGSTGSAPARFSFSGNDMAETPLSVEARKLAARPDLFDPLSLAAGEMTEALADALGDEVVAVLPDKAATTAGTVLSQGQVAYGRIPSFIQQSGAVAARKDGVLIVEPASHNLARYQRVNRSALAGLTRELADRGYLPAMDAAHFAASGNARGELDRAYLKVFTEDWDDALFGSTSTRRMFRALGFAYSDPEVRAANYPAASMSTDLKRELEALLYSVEGGTMMIGQGNFIGIMMGDGPEDAPAEPSLEDEPTEKYPGGLPMNSEFKIGSEPGNALYIHNRDSGRGMFCTAQELALRMDNFGDQVNRPNFQSDAYTYAEANLSNVILSMNVGEANLFTEHFKDGRIDTSAPRVGYGKIPESFAQQIKEIQESMNNRVGGLGRGGARTPPPTP